MTHANNVFVKITLANILLRCSTVPLIPLLLFLGFFPLSVCGVLWINSVALYVSSLVWVTQLCSYLESN